MAKDTIYLNEEYGLDHTQSSKTVADLGNTQQDYPALWEHLSAKGWTAAQFGNLTAFDAAFGDAVWQGKGGASLPGSHVDSNNTIYIPAGEYRTRITAKASSGKVYGKGSGYAAANNPSDNTQLIPDAEAWMDDDRTVFQIGSWGDNKYVRAGGLDGLTIVADNDFTGLRVGGTTETTMLNNLRVEGCKVGIEMFRPTPVTCGVLSISNCAEAGIRVIGSWGGTLEIATLSGDDNDRMIETVDGFGSVAGGAIHIGTMKVETGVRTEALGPWRGQIAAYLRGRTRLTIDNMWCFAGSIECDAPIVVDPQGHNTSVFCGNVGVEGFRNILHQVGASTGKKWSIPGILDGPALSYTSKNGGTVKLNGDAMTSHAVSCTDRLGFIRDGSGGTWGDCTPAHAFIYENGGTPPPPPPPPPSTITGVTISGPSEVDERSTAVFTASVQGTGNFDPAVTWSAVDGTIQNGVYVAPAVDGDDADVIRATSVQDPSKFAEITVNVKETDVQAGWKADWFQGMNFETPIRTTVEPEITFDWLQGSPYPDIPLNGFSARFTRDVDFGSLQDWEIETDSDDGIRVWVGSQLVIDNWTNHAVTTDREVVTLAGVQTVKVEFYENGGRAVCRFRMNPVAAPPPPPPPPSGDWAGEYFSNKTWSGTPLVTRQDPEINFRWMRAVPAPGMPTDNYSVRWTKQIAFDGDYDFVVNSDDGFRIKIDGAEVMANMTPHSEVQDIKTLTLNGTKTVVVEYFEQTGDAVMQLSINKVGAAPPPTPDGSKAIIGVNVNDPTSKARADKYRAAWGIDASYVVEVDLPNTVEVGAGDAGMVNAARNALQAAAASKGVKDIALCWSKPSQYGNGGDTGQAITDALTFGINNVMSLRVSPFYDGGTSNVARATLVYTDDMIGLGHKTKPAGKFYILCSKDVVGQNNPRGAAVYAGSQQVRNRPDVVFIDLRNMSNIPNGGAGSQNFPANNLSDLMLQLSGSERANVVGYWASMPGLTNAADLDYVPGWGAMSISSFSGNLTGVYGQTPFSFFTSRSGRSCGALWSGGSVSEPWQSKTGWSAGCLVEQFPKADVMIPMLVDQKLTIGEALHGSVKAPGRYIMVGDPLCRPWADIYA